MATKEQRIKAHKIIHIAVVAASTASGAMAQGAIFGADTGVLIGIYLGMIASLGELFGQSVSEQAAMSLLKTSAGAGIAAFGVKAILGFLPGLGNMANASISAAYTEKLGWKCFDYFDEHFSEQDISETHKLN